MAWFDRTKDEFTEAALLKKGCGLYVEIGVWKGDSSAWVMENVKPTFAYGVDQYLADFRRDQAEIDEIYEAAAARLAVHTNYMLVREDSQSWLRRGPVGRKVDLLYLDGRHDAAGVVLDFCLAWELLADDAVVIFDDFGIGRRKANRHVPEGVEALALAFGDQIDYFHRGPLQAAFRIKSKAPPLEPSHERLAQKQAARSANSQGRSMRGERRAKRIARIRARALRTLASETR